MDFNRKEYNFYVYILSNYERTCFYVGFCNNIERRVIEHMCGNGCEYSKKYKTVDLLYYEWYQYVADAIAREKQLKGWRREKKIFLIKTKNPNLEKLNQKLFNELEFTDNDITDTSNLLKEQYREKV